MSLRSRAGYFLADAADEWRHSPGVNLVAAATLASALFIAGLVLLTLSNVTGWIVRLRGDARVQVYLRDGASARARMDAEALLAGLPGVSRVQYVDKEEALRRFRESFGDLADLSTEPEGNPLPASLEVYLAPGPGSAEVAERISRELARREGVEEVGYDRPWLYRLDSWLRLARMGGAGLAVMVFAAVCFVMASVLRLAVYARREEIEIMLLVGASPAFVRGPFLVAGLVQGLAASLVSLGTVEAVRRAALAYAGSSPGALMELMAGRPLGASLSVLLVLIGLVVSLFGSFLAVRRWE